MSYEATRHPFLATPKDWSCNQLNDLTTKVGSGATPKGGQKVYLTERIKYGLVRSQNVFNRSFDGNNLAFISDEAAEKLNGVLLEEGDILLNITGDGVTFGRACMVDASYLPCVVNQHVSIIRCNEKLEPGFLLGFLSLPRTKKYIASFNAGGSRRAVTQGHIKSFIVPLPPLPEQRRIASILGSLDDKIELNRKMNATLEEMAQAIFKSWFIDFDGCDDLVESELGMIPRGWEVRQWKDLTTLAYGKGLKGYRDNEGSVEVFGTNGPIGWTTKALWQEPTVVVGRKGAYRGVHFTTRPSWTIDTAFYLQPSDNIDIRWAFYAIKQYDINSMDSGSAIPSTNRNSFYALQVVLPPEAIQKKFRESCEPLWKRQQNNNLQSKTLAKLRDTLLPKLISGEIRVPEAEERVEDAVKSNPPPSVNRQSQQLSLI